LCPAWINLASINICPGSTVNQDVRAFALKSGGEFQLVRYVQRLVVESGNWFALGQTVRSDCLP
jgi:hypothetical protein